MQLPQWWLTELQCLQWQLSKLQHPQWRPTKLRHPALGNGGGGRLLPPFKACRPLQSPLLAGRLPLSRPSSSSCQHRRIASPCRRRPGFSSCRAVHGPLPPGSLLGWSLPGSSHQSRPGHPPGFLFGRSSLVRPSGSALAP